MPETEQLRLPYADDIVATPHKVEIDWDRRTTFNRLLIATCAEIGAVTCTRDVSAGIAEPPIIERGLYIDRADTRTATAEQLYDGVVFPSDEFTVISRSPRDLTKHVRSRTREANKTLFDRDEADQKVGRSAAHALETQSTKLSRYIATMADKRLKLLSLLKDIDPPHGVVHFKAKNLERVRKNTDEAIHETAEVASINLNFDTTAIKGLHNVIRYNLYGTNQARRMQYWRRYVVMTGRHTKAKIVAAGNSQTACERELRIYGPYLDNA